MYMLLILAAETLQIAAIAERPITTYGSSVKTSLFARICQMWRCNEDSECFRSSKNLAEEVSYSNPKLEFEKLLCIT